MGNPYETSKGELSPEQQILAGCVASNSMEKPDILRYFPKEVGKYFADYLEDARELSIRHHKEFPTDDESLKAVISGRVFELLAFSEYKRKLVQQKGETTQTQNMLVMSELLCNICSHPEEYGMDLHGKRIPDDVYIGVTKEGSYVIYALVEAKLGNLDARAMDQISLKGSRGTINTICNTINTMFRQPDTTLPEDLALVKSILEGQDLVVSPKVRLELVVPGTDGAGFSTEIRFKDSQVQAKYLELQRSEGIEAKSSIFNRTEVAKMTNAIFEMLKVSPVEKSD